MSAWPIISLPLCAATTANAGAKISELHFLSKADEKKLKIDLNQTSFDYPREKCVHQLFSEQVKNDPEKIAVVFENEQLSYQQLYDKSCTLAMYLQSLGVKPDSLAGICVERSLDMMVGLMGILQAGGAYVPLDPEYPEDRLSYMLENSKLDIVLTQNKLISKVASLAANNPNAQIICIDKDWPLIEKSVKDLRNKKVELRQDVSTNHLAYVIYTSGSTGKPKGVMIEHRALVNFLCSMSVMPGIKKEDRLLAVTTYCFDIAGLEFYLPLINGAQLRICRNEDVKNAASLMSILKEHNTTIMQGTPAVWQLLFYAGWKNEEKIRILVGGEALSETLKNNFASTNSKAWNMYGPT
ncbi:MAG: AMP-binding protein, partial [Bacteroidales bacterium]|nr:AMP-binding protein [Bacteroidales bacterium]